MSAGSVGLQRRFEIPGFVDLQVNGFEGVDFSSEDLTEESFSEACRNLIGEGTAAILPTMITSSSDIYEHNLPNHSTCPIQ